VFDVTLINNFQCKSQTYINTSIYGDKYSLHSWFCGLYFPWNTRKLEYDEQSYIHRVSTYIMTSITAWPIILTLILGINVYIHLNAGLYILPNYSKYILSCLFSNYRKNNLWEQRCSCELFVTFLILWFILSMKYTKTGILRTIIYSQ
jgi:hypothetical protein